MSLINHYPAPFTGFNRRSSTRPRHGIQLCTRPHLPALGVDHAPTHGIQLHAHACYPALEGDDPARHQGRPVIPRRHRRRADDAGDLPCSSLRPGIGDSHQRGRKQRRRHRGSDDRLPWTGAQTQRVCRRCCIHGRHCTRGHLFRGHVHRRCRDGAAYDRHV